MSIKRFELSVSPSLSLLGRAVLVGSVLSFAAACARKDTAKIDSAATDTTTVTSSSANAAPAPVASVSTGETTTSTESKPNTGSAAANTSATNTSASTSAAAKPTASTSTAATPAHHTVHHTDSSASKRAATTSSATPAMASSSTARTISDTGQKAAADTSKKTASAGGGSDHLLVSPQEYEGWKMFSVYCYRCHGVDAMGGGIAPNLRHSVSSEGSVTHEVFIQTVTNGRLDKGMPTWKALLSPEQMEDLWLYINARSSGRLAPGRPHMASGANP